MEPLQPDDPAKIDMYELIGVLGQGGMGRVYLGRSPDDVIVAVKVMKAEFASNRNYIERFRREMGAAEVLGNGYTAALVGCDPDAAAPWLATKFIAGPSLGAMIGPARAGERLTPLDVGAVWWLAFGLIKALTEIHACGIVHRDIKPANVIIACEGPKVIDFGVSLGLSSYGSASGRLTGVGGRVGTPDFMSPEQLRYARDTMAASDIFSLGLVLVSAATGTVPDRDNLGRVLWNGPALRALPRELLPLIQRCLRTHPENRAGLTELLGMVLAAKRGRYVQAEPSFWPQPMAGRVARAVDAIRRGLPATVVRNLSDDAGASGQGQGQEQEPGGGTKPETQPPTHDYGQRQRTKTLRLPLPMDGILFHAYRPSAGVTVIRRPGDPLDAAAYLLDAETLWKNRYYVEAEDAYRASLELDKGNAAAHVDLGCLLWDQRRYRDATTAFRDALNYAPELIAARRNLFIVTKDGGGDEKLSAFLKDELRRYSLAVLATEANDAAGHANHGDALCCLERDEDAVPRYQQALTCDEGNPILLGKLEYVTRRLGVPR